MNKSIIQEMQEHVRKAESTQRMVMYREEDIVKYKNAIRAKSVIEKKKTDNINNKVDLKKMAEDAPRIVIDDKSR